MTKLTFLVLAHVNIITQNKEHTKFIEWKAYNMEDPNKAYQMQVWLLLKVTEIISMKKKMIFYYTVYPECSHNVLVKCWNLCSFYFVKKIFFLKSKIFSDALCLLWKKTPKIKQSNKNSYVLLKWFSLIITSLPFGNFIQWAVASVYDRSLWNFSKKV